MNHNNDFFNKMCKEAIDELASGETGWKDANNNTLLLACFGMLYNHLMHKLIHPLRWIAGSAIAAVIAYIVSVILGG